MVDFHPEVLFKLPSLVQAAFRLSTRAEQTKTRDLIVATCQHEFTQVNVSVVCRPTSKAHFSIRSTCSVMLSCRPTCKAGSQESGHSCRQHMVCANIPSRSQILGCSSIGNKWCMKPLATRLHDTSLQALATF